MTAASMAKTGKTCIQIVAGLSVVFVCIVNVFFLLLGVGTIILAKMLEKEIDKRVEIMDLLDKVSFDGWTLASLIRLIVILLIVCGSFAIIISAGGGISALFRIKILLIIYIIIVVLCVILEIILLNFWLNLINGIHEWLFGEFNMLLKKYNGPQAVDLYSVGWNLMFVLFDCCAVSPVTSVYNDFQALPSDWWGSGSRGSDIIPPSCCEDATIDNYLSYNNSLCTVNLIDTFHSGCYIVFYDIFKMLADVAYSIVAFLFFVEILSIAASVFIVFTEFSKRRINIV